MIKEIILMDGYGFYVWSAYLFTLVSFAILYAVIKIQFVKEKEKFNVKFSNLASEKIELAKNQKTYREILANISVSKI